MAEKQTHSDISADVRALLEAAAADRELQREELRLQREELKLLRGSQPPRTINFGDADYQEKLRRETKAFKNRVMQNSIEADPEVVQREETFERLTKLKAGLYLGGAVQVMVSPRNDVNFVYKNKTIDQRMAQKDQWRSFDELVEKVWTEIQTPAPPAA